jgi:predicted nuclease with RNAse H fold
MYIKHFLSLARQQPQTGDFTGKFNQKTHNLNIKQAPITPNCGALPLQSSFKQKNLTLPPLWVHLMETLIIGLDLAGVETRSTGFCVLTNLLAETCLLYSNKEIYEKITTARPSPAVVAIDAPLSLPPGRKSLEERIGPHLRQCDRELLNRGIRFFPVTLGPMRKLTTRGIQLKHRLENAGLRAIEAYPGGAQDVLGIPRKHKGLDLLRHGLEGLGIDGLSSAMSDHELDAVTCAYVGKLFVERQAEIYGDSESGIVMPKKRA